VATAVVTYSVVPHLAFGEQPRSPIFLQDGTQSPEFLAWKANDTVEPWFKVSNQSKFAPNLEWPESQILLPPMAIENVEPLPGGLLPIPTHWKTDAFQLIPLEWGDAARFVSPDPQPPAAPRAVVRDKDAIPFTAPQSAPKADR
jgi:hypothetical protein